MGLLDKLKLRAEKYFATHVPCILLGGKLPASLNATQALFIEWNSARLGISMEQSRDRFHRSWTAIAHGHSGYQYRKYLDVAYQSLQVFSSDENAEVMTSYYLHAPMHFLRMLSYRDIEWDDNSVLVREFARNAEVNILDYGCGLAQASRSLALCLRSRGVDVRLFLVDIPTIRKPFLIWIGRKYGIPIEFLDCTIGQPLPPLPFSEICFATEFFEHVYNPMDYLDAIDGVLKQGGILITNVNNHTREFMHVTPNLECIRLALKERLYVELYPNRMYRKTATLV